MKKTIYYYFFICLFLCTILSGCTKETASIKKSSFCLNTIITIELYNTTDETLLTKGIELCRQYEQLFSKTMKNSDIYAINHSFGKTVTVSDETIHLIEQGKKAGELSQGMFDISIGAISNLWNFTDGSQTIPTPAAIATALNTVDYSQIQVSGNAVTVPVGMQLDLGAIAKGYIGDKLKEFYLKNGVTSGLLSLGGNIICIGTPPNKDSYHIGIKKPFSQNESITGVYVKDQCVVTSGIYERYFEKDKKLYHHVLDPFTGYPAKTDLLSVTIITDNSMNADILSTTCLMVGLEKAKELLSSYEQNNSVNIEAIFITKDKTIVEYQ